MRLHAGKYDMYICIIYFKISDFPFSFVDFGRKKLFN